MSATVRHLVLVAGHAIYLGGSSRDCDADRHWALQDFQRNEPPFYIEHIRAGVMRAADDASALLMFSGGQSRIDAGPRSEAASYLTLAEQLGWWAAPRVRARAAVEEYARDSFENLLFGICRFRELTGRVPNHVTIVSWAFKEERFDRHREAIRFPSSRVRFEAVNQPLDLAAAREGEQQTLAEFARDPYGSGSTLAAKRRSRDPFHRIPPYASTCPELARLLGHRGPEPFRGELPWDVV